MTKNIPNIKALIFMKEHSERVPKKNIKDLCGKPLFYYIFDTLSKSKYIDEIILNTDSIKIANMVKSFFDVTIHMRPDHLLKITSNEANLILEHDLSLSDGNYYLQTHSTNPLLSVNSIDRSIEFFFEKNKNYDSLFSVNKYQSRFYDESGNGINHNQKELVKTQDLPNFYEENSCIYIFSKDSFTKHKNRIGSKPILFPLTKIESCDIDTPEDFEFAEYLMEKKNKDNS